MAQAQLQEELIPSGGIADFVMSDAEIAALEAEEAREEFGQEGIARFEPIAKRMASYGRFGDDNLAHVETGEILVPRALIDQSPELKESIFNHLREMGVENPERYVVGSGANSINPDTGMPEFFFKSIARAVKKTVSNVAKGVSKAVSKVGKVLKKVAPVVLPIALAMTPLGPMYGAALGSGIGTLIQGGNIGDALKAAVVSGALGGISAGVSSKLNSGTFVGGVKSAAANPLARLSQTGSALSAGNPFQSFTPTGDQIADDIAAGRADAGVSEAQELAGTQGTTTGEIQTQATDLTPDQTFAQPDYSPAGNVPSTDPNVAMANDPYFQDASGAFDATGRNTMGYRYEGISTAGGPEATGYDYRFGGTGGPTPDRVATFGEAPALSETLPNYKTVGNLDNLGATETSFFDKAKGLYNEYLSPSRNALTDPQKIAEAQKLVDASQGKLSLDKAVDMVVANTPGTISSYAPLAAVGGLAAYGAGFFDAPPEEENELAEEFQQTGADLLAQSPETFMLAGRDPRYSQGQYVVPTQYGLGSMPLFFNNPFMRYQAPQMRAAAGGEVYPRRNGGIMPNEGIPDQDSVRALLMPGEFVMTKDAVKGLGGGSMTRGIDNMYSMMRNLEAKGQVA